MIIAFDVVLSHLNSGLRKNKLKIKVNIPETSRYITKSSVRIFSSMHLDIIHFKPFLFGKIA